MEELIIHPRVQTDFYKNAPNMEVFSAAFQQSKNPVCYNGDLFSKGDIDGFSAGHPNVETVMLGRGLLMNPCLANAYLFNTKLDKRLLKCFHEQIYDGYKSILSGDVNVLYKMKELWNYMISSFSDNAKHAKRIKKSQSLRDYDEVVSSLFSELDLA
jgi:tRNA-dihydrouridine synthase